MMSRVEDPQLSPDGHTAAFAVRRTNFKANKGVTSIWIDRLDHKNAAPHQLAIGNSPRWSSDGHILYYLSSKSGSTQLWRIAVPGGAPQQVSALPVGINNYKLSPDAHHVLLSLDVFTDCSDLACTKARLKAAKANKATGRLYKKLFVRHWDQWSDGRRSQLFIAGLNGDGKLNAKPTLLSRGIDGDIPSKPFGDESEYAFSPDGKTVYFDVRVAGASEPWSTNVDIYTVPADGSAAPHNLAKKNKAWDGYPLVSHNGKTLYYLAMKTPGFEADRFCNYGTRSCQRPHP